MFGVGTWVAFGAGRVPVGFDAGNALFNTAEETGGSYDATLVSHNHNGTTGSENANHSHSGSTDVQGQHNHGYTESFGSPGAILGGGFLYQPRTLNTSDAGAHNHNFTTGGISNNHQHGFTTSTNGSSATNANIQPYITVFMWKRTA